MLPVVAVEVLLFLGRRDLDKMGAISTRLEALMAVTSATYPFRRLRRVHLRASAPMFDVSIEDNEDHEVAFRSSDTMDDALIYLAPFIRRSYVDEFKVELGLSGGNYRVTTPQWTFMTDIFRSGAARRLLLRYVDLSALDDNALVDAVRCSKLEVTWCDVRDRLLSDDVLRSCAANGVLDLQVCYNRSYEEHTVSEDALLEFCFPPGGPSRAVQLNNLKTSSDTFAAKFFERLLAPACTSGPRGFLVFTTILEQRRLADYVQHLVPGQSNPTYRFASRRNGDRAYHFISSIVPADNTSHREFSFGYFDPRPTNDDHDDDDEEDTLTE